MSKFEQTKFVTDLSGVISRQIIQSINDGKIPEDWDGYELRCLLADKHEQSAKMTTVRRNPRSRAARDYKNTVLVNNL
jgi:hypothetical protein